MLSLSRCCYSFKMAILYSGGRPDNSSAPSGGNSAPSGGNSATAPSTGGNPAPSGGNSAPSGGNSAPSAGVTPELFQQMLAQVQAGGGGGMGVVPPATPQLQPQQVLLGSQLQQAETLYQNQLEQLQMMGFPNRQANLNGMRSRCGVLPHTLISLSHLSLLSPFSCLLLFLYLPSHLSLSRSLLRNLSFSLLISPLSHFCLISPLLNFSSYISPVPFPQSLVLSYFSSFLSYLSLVSPSSISRFSLL